MGAIAEGFAAYAQPLLDQTDGSLEQMEKALAVSQLCFNLALLPEDRRVEALGDVQLSLKMNDEEFDDFLRSIALPMIRRHQEMFAPMHQRNAAAALPSHMMLSDSLPSDVSPPTRSINGASPKIDRYAPCPCNSGRKYKFCCGKKSR